jgi:hypothetical protein
MATKQFKIGERAIGGIIKVDIEKTLVTVSALEYYTKKEICSKKFWLTGVDVEYDIELYLDELSTAYYADKIMKYIREKMFKNYGIVWI